MKVALGLFGIHLVALAFGLAGILIAIPHPELWAGNPTLAQVYTFGMAHGGATHIIFGAATMVAFGIYALGWRKTLLFFVLGSLLPLCAELLGTGTGWPFGGYSYTDFLGFKIGGRVPYSVPLSWFYMGFASYLLAVVIVAGRGVRIRAWQPVLLGAWLLTAWDLVLDPAMASGSVPISFWIWHEHGSYFGMPLRNLIGWFATGLIFIALSRFAWREEAVPQRIPIWLPLALYLANVLWAMALALSVGLWQTALFAVALGVIPALFAWRTQGQQKALAPRLPFGQSPGPARGTPTGL